VENLHSPTYYKCIFNWTH